MLNISYETLGEKLGARAITSFAPDKTLSEIAAQAHTSPMALYLYLSGETDRSVPKQGSGIGRKTVEEVCSELNVSFSELQKSLLEDGMEIAADEKLKEAAGRLEMTPLELYMSIRAVKHSR